VITGVGPLSIESCEILANITQVDGWQVTGKIMSWDENKLVVRSGDGLVRLSVRANENWRNFQNAREKFLHPPSFYG